MPTDMLDFEGQDLYFDEPLQKETQRCIDGAAEAYGKESSRNLLYRAYFLEPEHPTVLVALYRYFYYQHLYADALIIAERVLKLFSMRLGWPANWQELTSQHVDKSSENSMTDVRFYLLALKGSGYLELRLERIQSAIERLSKVVEVDNKDRLGAASLLEIAEEEVERQSGIYRLKFNQ